MRRDTDDESASKSSFRWLGWIGPIVIFLLVLAFWELWVCWRDTPPWLLPRPSQIARTLVDDRGLLLRNAWVTFKEVIIGFGLALVCGVLLAIVIDASVVLARVIYPIVIASQTVPIIALAPLLLVWFGYGLLPKVLVTGLVAFFPIVVNTVDGLRSADRDTLNLMRSFGAGRWRRFRLVTWPGALPALFAGARIGAALSVIGAVFGEYVASNAGLGYVMNISNAQLATDRVFAAIVLLSLIAVGLFGAIAAAERLCLPWRRFLLDEHIER